LFIPCPNSDGLGDNKEKVIPNPACKSSLHLSMCAFVGKLMGIAIRGGHVLNLDLPSVVWKPLVGDRIVRADLEAIHSLCLKMLESIEGLSALSGVTPTSFNENCQQKFITVSVDGREIELKENGANVAVTWDNRAEYMRLEETYRLQEYKVQVEAIRRGLSTIVPVQLLSLFTWRELENMVCGERDVDVDYLRRNTTYEGVRADDKHILMLWEVLKSFSDHERRLFLRFVWGQSRLPYDEADFTQKFKIQPARRDVDEAHPVSHTCFFSVELPRYTNPDSMRKKILYAIYNCRSIDTDGAAQNVDWDAE